MWELFLETQCTLKLCISIVHLTLFSDVSLHISAFVSGKAMHT